MALRYPTHVSNEMFIRYLWENWGEQLDGEAGDVNGYQFACSVWDYCEVQRIQGVIDARRPNYKEDALTSGVRMYNEEEIK